MIKAQVIGHLGRDAVVNNVNGKSVINFSVAHTESYNNAQGVKTDKTIWVDCAYWTDRTGIAPYLKKGTHVYVDGAPDVRTFATQSGSTGASLVLRVGSIQLLGGKKEDSFAAVNQQTAPQARNVSAPPPPPVTAANNSDISEPIDDLPF